MMHKWLVIMVLTTFSLFGVDAKLTIEKDVEQRARIGVVDASASDQRRVHALFVTDFVLSGHFLPGDTYQRGSYDRMLTPSQTSKEYVLKYRYDDTDGAVLEVKLIRASDKQVVMTKRYAVPRVSKAPFLVHKAVYDINRVLRYPDISWINRYVLYARYVAPRKSVIGVADYTFTFQKTVIKGGLNLFPKWADANQRAFYYTSLNGTVPTLYKLDIYTGRKSRVTSSQGMLVCSDVSRDGNRLLLTMAPEGQPDIYEFNRVRGTKRRVTTFSGIDVGGRYARNDDEVVFVSNRLGYANVFKKTLRGGGVSQVVYHGKKNNACDAHDTRVVYASRESDTPFHRNRFNIYLTDTDEGNTRPLTTTGVNLSPRFSYDGKMVAYIKQRNAAAYIGYINLATKRSKLFKLRGKLQSIDW